MIDLHTHSTVSDGSEPPATVVDRAAESGCSAVALTDHDSVAGLAEARARAAQRGLRLVPGCEVSCRRPSVPGVGVPEGGSVHVLVYLADPGPGADGEPGDGPLYAELVALREDRATRNRALAARLSELGIDVRYEDVVAEAGSEEGVGRPHFARALVKAGAAEDVDDAFERWLGNDRPAYVPKARLDAVDVVRLAHASRAIAVLAHPLSTGLGPAPLEHLVRDMAGEGLDGIEAVYASYHPDERAALRAMATRAGLLATGGSDFHGSFKPGLEVGTGRGDLRVPDEVLDELDARLAARA